MTLPPPRITHATFAPIHSTPLQDAKKSQAQILEELKPVLTTMMQKMVETQAEDPMEFMIAYLKDIVSDTPAS